MTPKPFIFMTAVESVQLTGRKAGNLAEFEEGLRTLPGSVIYHHTHRFYGEHSYLGHQDRSDFALWLGNDLKEEAAAERMGALDLREYKTLEDLRAALLQVLEPLREQEGHWNRRVPPGLEFHFCDCATLVLPAGFEANNLEEFLRAVEHVDISSLSFHLIEAPLRLPEANKVSSNDFSLWLSEALGFQEQAEALALIDPYYGDLESVRKKVLGVFRKDRLRSALNRAADRVRREGSGEAVGPWFSRWRKGG